MTKHAYLFHSLTGDWLAIDQYAREIARSSDKAAVIQRCVELGFTVVDMSGED